MEGLVLAVRKRKLAVEEGGRDGGFNDSLSNTEGGGIFLPVNAQRM